VEGVMAKKIDVVKLEKEARNFSIGTGIFLGIVLVGVAFIYFSGFGG
jgi:hypothetical protein